MTAASRWREAIARGSWSIMLGGGGSPAAGMTANAKGSTCMSCCPLCSTRCIFAALSSIVSAAAAEETCEMSATACAPEEELKEAAAGGGPGGAGGCTAVTPGGGVDGGGGCGVCHTATDLGTGCVGTGGPPVNEVSAAAIERGGPGGGGGIITDCPGGGPGGRGGCCLGPPGGAGGAGGGGFPIGGFAGGAFMTFTAGRCGGAGTNACVSAPASSCPLLTWIRVRNHSASLTA